MKIHLLLIKYGEIGIKGKNRYLFEDALICRIRDALRPLEGEFDVYKTPGRVYVKMGGEYDLIETIDRLKSVFGIVGICPVVRLKQEGIEGLSADVVRYMKQNYPNGNQTFKVEARRSNKSYPLDSMQINCVCGSAILDQLPGMKVDVHNPQIRLFIEVREGIYLYSKVIKGPGGMPVGTGGKAQLLLSGGIDSPVAGYLVAKRGVQLSATYFHAPPYTGERAKQKVIDLVRILSGYAGTIQLQIVKFTPIQLSIYENCPHDELTVILRRYMMRIAEYFAKQNGCLGLVTGESIGQVASQTMDSLAATDAVCTLPVYRPLIGFDKSEIVQLAKKIGTYETSILPYEDCCSIFVAKHPVTKPKIWRIEESEKKLAGDIDELVKTAIDSAKVIAIG